MRLRDFDYNMMNGSSLWMVFMLIRVLAVIAIIVLAVFLIVRLARRKPYPGIYRGPFAGPFAGPHPGQRPGPGPGQQPDGRGDMGDYGIHAGKALEILSERYAKGEIDDEEYIKKKAELTKH